jgi:pimeloyl-ACP methyl ester carboxylesterase
VLVPFENAAVLLERIPSAKLEVIAGAGHGYPAQDPVRVHQIVTDFLRTH